MGCSTKKKHLFYKNPVIERGFQVKGVVRRFQVRARSGLTKHAYMYNSKPYDFIYFDSLGGAVGNACDLLVKSQRL